MNKCNEIELSVIIPTTGKRIAYINEAVESVGKSASKIKHEVIIILNGGEVSKGEIIEHIRKEVRVIEVEEKGANRARNKGLEVALGKFCVFLDDDDWFYENTLNEVVEIAVREELHGVSSSVDVRKDDKIVKRLKNSDDSIIDSVLTLDIIAWPLCHVWRTDAIKQCKWNENVDYAHDQLFLMEVVKTKDIKHAFKNITIGVYRIHENDRQSSKENKIGTEIVLIRVKYLQILIEYLAKNTIISSKRWKSAVGGIMLHTHQAFVYAPRECMRTVKEIIKLEKIVLDKIDYLKWLTFIIKEMLLYFPRRAKRMKIFRKDSRAF